MKRFLLIAVLLCYSLPFFEEKWVSETEVSFMKQPAYHYLLSFEENHWLLLLLTITVISVVVTYYGFKPVFLYEKNKKTTSYAGADKASSFHLFFQV